MNEAATVAGYWPADYIYILTLLIVILCLYRGHRGGDINLWDCVRTTTKDGKLITDARKLWEAGAFVVMTVGFAYLVVQGRLTEFYAGIYVAAFVAARSLRDREQRLNRVLDKMPVPTSAPPAAQKKK